METTRIILIVALLVGVAFPAYAIAFGHKTRELLLKNPAKKNYVFRLTCFQLIALALVTMLPIWIGKYELNTVGLNFILNPIWVISLFLISFLGIWVLSLAKLTPDQAKKAQTKSERVLFLMPTTKPECKMMIFTSFVAGICEEIIYRGFLLWFLLNYLPLLPAIVLTNLPFALAHLTSTGFRNTIWAFILGLIFTVAYLLTDSLWLSILLHILIDVYAAIIGYKINQTLNSSNPEEFQKIILNIH
ncbi:MAG: CPBP family intramembrane metalloprotease [Cytophagales bacterium]|nr:CPBP family intramembrane metalloprotease [Cytophagales bacterium]